MHESFFTQMNSDELSSLIRNADASVCYAAPGIQVGPARAMVSLAERLGPELILVFLDVDENVIRMGYGEVEAIEALKDAGIRVEHIAGLRNGLIVADGQGFSYTPTALYLEREAERDEALNAMRLTSDQAAEAMARLSPASKAVAMAQAETDEKRQAIEAATSETTPVSVDTSALDSISANLKAAPPARFDVARQVRVFQPHFQYVELSLTGAAIQRHRLTIPKVIQTIGNDQELEGRLKTTFDLIDKNTEVSSKALDKELRDIREKLTRSLGKKHGRIVRKAARPKLEQRLSELQGKIEEHQETIKAKLDETLAQSKALVMDYYLPVVRENPPDEIYGEHGEPSDEKVKEWLDRTLSGAFPEPDELINNIKLEMNFKDVTFETLNRDDFLESIKTAYPGVDWDKTYNEFRAAGEASESGSTKEDG